MSKGLRIVPLGYCASARRGPVPYVGRITRSIGGRVVNAMLGGILMYPQPRSGRSGDEGGLEWCPVCERYFNPKAEHGCLQENVSKNRRNLESWLGKFKIK